MIESGRDETTEAPIGDAPPARIIPPMTSHVGDRGGPTGDPRDAPAGDGPPTGSLGGVAPPVMGGVASTETTMPQVGASGAGVDTLRGAAAGHAGHGAGRTVAGTGDSSVAYEKGADAPKVPAAFDASAYADCETFEEAMVAVASDAKNRGDAPQAWNPW